MANSLGAEGPEVDRLLLVGVAAMAGGLAWAAPIEVGIAMAIALLSLARRGAPLIALVSALAFAFTAARASRTVQAYEHERAVVLQATRWPARCVIDGIVSRSPVLLGDAFKLDVDVTRGECGEGVVRGRVTLHVPSDVAPPLVRGDVVQAVAQLAPGYRFWNDDTGDPRPAQARRGVLLSGGAEDLVVVREGRGLAAFIDRLRDRLRRRIVATFPADTAAMARALIIGEDDLTASDQSAFRRSGLAHLLAVSGMHLVVIVATLVAVLRGLLARVPALATRVAPQRVAAVVGIALAWAYADLAGASGSAIRAAWMTSAALLAHVLARRPDTWRAFGLSILGMVLFDPLVGFDFSFALSAAATAGLMGLGGRIAAPMLNRTPAWTAPIVRALATSLAASIACAPVLACMTAELPIAGLVANLVAVPLGEMAALPLCLGHALPRGVAIGKSGMCHRGVGGARDGAWRRPHVRRYPRGDRARSNANGRSARGDRGWRVRLSARDHEATVAFHCTGGRGGPALRVPGSQTRFPEGHATRHVSRRWPGRLCDRRSSRRQRDGGRWRRLGR